MSSTEGWDAISYQWRSPAWQRARYPAAKNAMEPAVRAFPTPGEGVCYAMQDITMLHTAVPGVVRFAVLRCESTLNFTPGVFSPGAFP